MLHERFPDDNEVASLRIQAGQGDWASMDILERLQIARQEDEERWEKENDASAFLSVRNVRRGEEPQPVILNPPSDLHAVSYTHLTLPTTPYV